MSRTLVFHVMAKPLPPARRAVLLTLADMANQAGLCWPSIATLAEKCCLSVRSIFNHLNALEADGLLVRRTRRGRSSVYSLPCGDSTGQPAPLEPATPKMQPPAPPSRQSDALEPKASALSPGLSVVSVVNTMQAAGLQGAYDAHAVAELLEAPSDLSEFTEAASQAIKRKKGFAWAIARVAGRRQDAAFGTRPAQFQHAGVARVTVPGKPGRDPVLKQLEAEAAKAKPPSPSIRVRLAQLRSALASGASGPICRGTVG